MKSPNEGESWLIVWLSPVDNCALRMMSAPLVGHLDLLFVGVNGWFAERSVS